MGAASCPLFTASEKLKSGLRFLTLPMVISLSAEKRVDA